MEIWSFFMKDITERKRTRRKDTYFASPERSAKTDLYKQIDSISINPIVNELLKIVPGLLAVLNSNRQIITVNRVFIETLQIEHASELLGLRPGEALNCEYSHIMDAGCGTSEYCLTCGAAIALVVALENNIPNERRCIISSKKNGVTQDLLFNVKATPFQIEGEKFILLFIQDISVNQQSEYLKRVFFHDLANLISILETTTNLIEHKPQDEQPRLIGKLKKISSRLSQEVAIHRLLITSDNPNYNANFQQVRLEQLIGEIRDIVSYHKSVINKNLEILNLSNTLILNTDSVLLSRIILNMLINAFEASEDDDIVKLIFENQTDHLTIKVWNNNYISQDNSKRIFQKNFSTKQGIGRGLGTYSIKLICEQYLHGTVGFDSSEENKTTFYLQIPLKID